MSNRLAKKVLLIGWDAADWNMIRPLLDAGKMPALERIVNEGVIGSLASIRPILSPLLWTSIATGKRAFDHGITHFVETDHNSPLGLRPIRSHRRQCKALWNILTQSGISSNIVGWYASHPAEPINGAIVSDYHRHRPDMSSGNAWPIAKHCVHPERLTETMADLRVHPAELTEAHLLPFIPLAARIDQQTDRRLFELADTLAECATIHNAATWLMEHEPADFTAVFYPTIDHLGHKFMYYYPPRLDEIPEEDFEIYKDVMPGAYRYHDMMLKRLLDLAGDDTTVILCSDHGFHSDHRRPNDYGQEPDNEQWHRFYGIVAAKGNGLKVDERVYGASVLDLTPLVLSLFGLPIGEDMHGKVPDVFAEPFTSHAIKSWDDVPGECGQFAAGQLEEQSDSEEVIKQLVALGYLEAPGEDKQATIDKTMRESKYQIASSLADAGRLAEATDLMEALVREVPENHDFIVTLARWYASMENHGETRRVLAMLGSDLDSWPPFARYVLGMVELKEGNPESALAHFEMARVGNPNSVDLHCHVGHAYAKMHKWKQAREAFQYASQLNPLSAPPHEGLAYVLLAQDRNEEAAEAALRAVGLLHHFPQAHLRLGVALARLGMVERAIQALEICVAMNSSPKITSAAHERLAMIHEQATEDTSKAEEHRRLAELTQKGESAIN